MATQTCPLCGQSVDTLTTEQQKEEFLSQLECSKCGTFAITDDAKIELFTNSSLSGKKLRISAYTRERTISRRDIITITYGAGNDSIIPWISIHDAINRFPNRITERLDKALINLSKVSKYTGDKVNIEFTDYPLVFADTKNADSVRFIIDELTERGFLLKGPVQAGRFGQFSVSAHGWDRVHELESASNPETKQVFLAIWYDDSMDSVSDHGFKKAIRKAGYDPLRIDDKAFNGVICDEIIAEIRQSKFIVCDFTGQRGGVYFEAGFALGLGLPVIWTCRKDEIEKVHFDTRQYNHIVWENEEDLYHQLYNRIRATIV